MVAGGCSMMDWVGLDLGLSGSPVSRWICLLLLASMEVWLICEGVMP